VVVPSQSSSTSSPQTSRSPVAAHRHTSGPVASFTHRQLLALGQSALTAHVVEQTARPSVVRTSRHTRLAQSSDSMHGAPSAAGEADEQAASASARIAERGEPFSPTRGS
jgi:hypothetical protein